MVHFYRVLNHAGTHLATPGDYPRRLLKSVFGGYVPLACQKLCLIKVYSVANYKPQPLGKWSFQDPNLNTISLCICLNEKAFYLSHPEINGHIC